MNLPTQEKCLSVCQQISWEGQPHEKSMQLDRLATHIAVLPFWFKRIIGPVNLISQLPTIKVVLRNMGYNHIYHHRGQLSVYRRLLDVAMPGMYGSSADDAKHI